MGDDIHVIPTNDCIEHVESPDCDCKPIWDEENRKDFEANVAVDKVWVHHLIKENLQ